MADKTVIIRLAVKSGQFTAGLSQAGAATGKFANQVAGSANKAAGASMALGSASAMAGKMLVLGIGGALAVSAKAAIDFESSMAGVAKTTDMAGNSFEKNSGPLFAFGEALRQMSLRVPMNVNELAQIAEIGGQLGVETPNLLKFTEVMAAMGVTTNMSSIEAAKGFARFANIMRTPQQEFDRLGSIVVELGNNFATTESEILTFATRLAPVAAVVGMTEEQVFALSAALTSLGVPAERGGTALQRVFIAMKSAVDTGGGALTQFAEVAQMSADAFKTLFAESPAEAFAAFVRGLDTISRSGQNVFNTLDQMNLAEQRTIQVLLATASGYEVVDDAINSANTAGEENLALFEEAAKRYGTTASQIQLLGNGFNDLRIQIGNMVLSGGGLQFAMETMSQFFRIIKENLPTLGRFAQVAGTVAALNFGAKMFIGAKAALSSFSVALGKANTGLRVMPVLAKAGAASMMILQTAMFSVMAIGTALAALWLMQAIRAAELRMQVEQLATALADGVDPAQALTDSLRSADILTPEIENSIHNLGISTGEFVQSLLDGDNAFDLIGGSGKAFQEIIQDILVAQGRVGEPGAWAEVEQGLLDLGEAAEQADIHVEGFLSKKTGELTEALLMSGDAAHMSAEEMDNLARTAIELFGFDVTDSQFLDFVMNGRTVGSGLEFFRAGLMDVRDGIGEVDRTWQSYIKNLADGEDILDDFWETLEGGVEGFNEAIAEEMARVDEQIRGGFPVWGEYEQVVIGATDELGNQVTAGLDEVIAAQDLFLQDMTDFTNRMPQIMASASPQTLAWIESLEPGLRGAIGRLSDIELEELIAGANANFDQLNEVYMQRWMQVYPGAARAGFDVLIRDMGNWVTEFGPPGELGAQNFIDGMMTLMQMMPGAHQAEFLGYLTELLSNPEMLKEMGFDDIEAWIQGLLLAMQGMGDRIVAEWEAESADAQKGIVGAWETRSPSKWWHRFGMNWMEGLSQGIDEGIKAFGIGNKFTPEVLLKPTMSSGAPGASSSVSNAKTINLNFSDAAKGTVAETQTALTLLNLVGDVERGAGRMN